MQNAKHEITKQTCQTIRTKVKPPNETKLTKPNLPNQTYYAKLVIIGSSSTLTAIWRVFLWCERGRVSWWEIACVLLAFLYCAYHLENPDMFQNFAYMFGRIFSRELDKVLSDHFVLSLLLALGNPTVNYLSLDIEGAELQVLKSIPWDLVNIEVS